MADKNRRIDFDLDGIAHQLSDRTLSVPIYQRSYSWKDEHLDDYWNDLRIALADSDPEYFLGTVVLTRSTETDRLVVIDGQQRMATTSLLLAAIRDAYLDREDAKRAAIIQARFLSETDLESGDEMPKLVLNEEDDEYFRRRVIERESYLPTKESHHRILGAYEMLAASLKGDLSTLAGTQAEARLAKWVKFLEEDVVVVVVEVPTESDAFLIFETLNDRGADLTIADLLKNYLFGRSGSRLGTVKSRWIESLAQLDITAENDVFVTFLRHYWSSRYGAVRERELYSSIKERVSTSTQAVDFATKLQEASRVYAALLSSSHELWSEYGATARENVDTLLRLELEQYRPLLLAVVQHFPKSEVIKTLRALVDWSVRGLVVGGIGGGSTERAYCEAAVKVRDGELKTQAALTKQLGPIIPIDDAFEAAFATARITKAKIARYLLNALERKKLGVSEPELVPNANEEQVNLEHVLPQNAKPEEWPAFSPEEVQAWVHRIGNFALLAKGPNGRIGNKAYSVKQPVLMDSELMLTSEIAGRLDWTQAEIAQRQRELAKLAVATWPRQ